MPTYQFRCLECEEESVVKQSIHDDLPIACEKCGGQLRQRLSSASALTANSAQIQERGKRLAQQDRKLINKGDDNAWSDLVGEKPNPHKGG